jgi:hypothetical protein
MSSPEVIAWIHAHVTPTGEIVTFHAEPWSTVLRVPTQDGQVWFKACQPVQAFEPRLSAQLHGRWPDRVCEVLAHDEARAWLLLADAGTPLKALGNPPEIWLEVLPRYAELQQGEAAHALDHLAHGVPDLRITTLPARYHDLAARDLPVSADEQQRLRAFTDRFTELCAELESCGLPDTVQHDDLHMNNVYVRDDERRVLDWGDASIGNPFASLVVTFRFLEERNGLTPGDPWFARLRDAYLEPWGPGLTEVFELAMRVGTITHAFASMRARDLLPPETWPTFDTDLPNVLRLALQQL